jgi:hypothetical protein
LVDEREILVDASDSQRARVVDAPQLDRTPRRIISPASGLQKPAMILIKVDFPLALSPIRPSAPAQVQIDTAQRDDPAEALGDLLDAQDIIGRRHRCGPGCAPPARARQA